MSRSYDGYNSQEDTTGRGSPDTVSGNLEVIYGYDNLNHTTYFLQIVDTLTVNSGTEELTPSIVWLTKKLLAQELFSLPNFYADSEIEFWPEARLRIFSRTRRVPLKLIAGRLLETLFKYLLYRLRRKLRIHVSYNLYLSGLRGLVDEVRNRYFTPDQSSVTNSSIHINVALNLSFTDLFSSLYSAYRFRSSYIPERNWLRQVFRERILIRFLPIVSQPGDIYHSIEREELTCDAEEQTHI